MTDYGQVVVRQIKCRSIIMDTSIKKGIILGVEPLDRFDFVHRHVEISDIATSDVLK